MNFSFKRRPVLPAGPVGFASRFVLGLALLMPLLPLARAAESMTVVAGPAKDANAVTIATPAGGTSVVVDAQDYPLVQLAANLFADDVQRVTGKRPAVANEAAAAPQVILVGTLGKSALIQKLAAAGKLKDVEKIRGRWEATLIQVVANPLPGVGSALVIAGSDRRGAAYGLMELSEKIGVSPWYWWADVPVAHRSDLAVRVSAPQSSEPGVKFRGIFINDEDWGLHKWAKNTFEPEEKKIGPKTYEKVCELLLRLRLNYLWPAMHVCSGEFASNPKNVATLDRYGIVAGSSHCEPMLANNILWHEDQKGEWNYSLNRDGIHAFWEDSAKTRGATEGVWTLGIRGIHDKGMQPPPEDMEGKISLMTQIFKDQQELLTSNVTKEWGDVAQCFIPYKEVLPIFDAGLKVPDNVTLVWVDDNFGYIRRLSSPEERTRPGGSGIYWHLSYLGWPHSYVWLNTTAPAFMWSELHKAWENDARTLWVINVGDIKPIEIGIDYFARLAWNPDGFPLGAQRQFLLRFAAENFNAPLAKPITDLLMEYYRLGTVHKPEMMERKWALSLTPERAKQLQKDYQSLLERERTLEHQVPANLRDAYTELVGFPARVLAYSGQIFLADRAILENKDVSANQKVIADCRREIDAQVANYNTKVAGGKWNRMMPGAQTNKDVLSWISQVRWPWGEKNKPKSNKPAIPWVAEKNWRDAATANRQDADGKAKWNIVEGLGCSGRAVALLPASLDSSWAENDPKAPTLEYDFASKAGDAEALIDFLPAYRIAPGMKLRVGVRVDNGPLTAIEVPGSNGEEAENGPTRRVAVQNNFVRARVPLPALSAGKHTLKIVAMDPGAVLDRIHLPQP